MLEGAKSMLQPEHTVFLLFFFFFLSTVITPFYLYSRWCHKAMLEDVIAYNKAMKLPISFAYGWRGVKVEPVLSTPPSTRNKEA